MASLHQTPGDGGYQRRVAQRAMAAGRIKPGRQPLPREFVAGHQRVRIINAMVEEANERGPQTVTIADIVKRAGVARSTFYENFSSKEECLLAASELAVEETLQRVLDAAKRAGDVWPMQVRAGLRAFLAYVAEENGLARTCMIESLSAGAAGVARYERSIASFVPLLRDGRKLVPDGEILPETLEETIVGGIFWLVYRRITADGGAAVEGMLPELVEFALTPYLGPEEAGRAARTDLD